MSRCRTCNIRVTAQRLAVFEALSKDPTHPTADSLYAGLRRKMPSLSLSTVYRILESLQNNGLIRRVNTTDGIARYDGNLGPHQHLVCRRCGRMTDLEDASLSRLRLPSVTGFVAEELDIRIIGICPECHSAAFRSTEVSNRETAGKRMVSREKEEK